MKLRKEIMLLILAIPLFFYGCGGSNGKGGLQVLHFGDTDTHKIFKDIISDYNIDNPEHQATIENLPWTAYLDKLLTSTAGGAGPDVAWIANSHLISLVDKGMLLPLDDLIDKDPDLKKSDFWRKVIEFFTVDGELYCLPNDIAPVAVIYYNKELFDKAGIPYPRDDWDWDDFLLTAKRLTLKNDEGDITQHGFLSETWMNFVLSAGGDMVDDYKDPKRCLLNSRSAMQGVQFFYDLQFKHEVMPVLIQGDNLASMNLRQMFENKKVAMINSGIWHANGLNQAQDLEWDVAMFPRAPGKKHPRTVTGGSGWGIFKDTEYPEKAWEIVKHMAGEKTQRRLGEYGSFQPAMRSLAEDETGWLTCPPDPCNKGMLNEATAYVVFNPFTYKWEEVWSSAINPTMEKIWLQVVSVEQGMDDIVQRADEILAE